MKSISQSIIHALLLLTLLACGGGGLASSGGGGSGFGGTGVFVRGNVSQVNGEVLVMFSTDSQSFPKLLVNNHVLQLAFAQSVSAGSITVSGGGKTTTLNSRGEFNLIGISPTQNLKLTFVIGNLGSASLVVGSTIGQNIQLNNIQLNTNSGEASPEVIISIPLESSTSSSGSNLSDDDQISEDDVSEDDVSEDEVEEDEVSEDEVEEDEVSEDEVEEDEVSEDDISEDSGT